MKKNSGKAPAFQLYVMDWMSDLDAHPLEIEGAWMRIICKLWREPERGEATYTLPQWSRILRINQEKTREIIDYLKLENIANVTESNGNITVINRRMVRDRNINKSNAERQKRHRDKSLYDSNVESNEEVTPPSSSSSSISPSGLKNNNNIIFSVESRKLENILEQDIQDWSQAYPAVDIQLETKRAEQWCLANPTKTKKNYRRFLTNWFARTQEKGGNRNSQTKESVEDRHARLKKEGLIQ